MASTRLGQSNGGPLLSARAMCSRQSTAAMGPTNSVSSASMIDWALLNVARPAAGVGEDDAPTVGEGAGRAGLGGGAPGRLGGSEEASPASRARRAGVGGRSSDDTRSTTASEKLK